MRNIKLVCSLLVVFLSFSCSKDDGSSTSNPDFNSVTVVTKQPVLSTDNSQFTSGGNASINISSTNDYQVGICYNNVANPTIGNGADYSFQTNGGDFTNIIHNPLYGQTYYIRAFVKKLATGEVKYGNEVTFQIPVTLTTSIVKNISVTGFSVDVNVGSSLGANTERGVCYSTSQNPSIDNDVITDPTDGSGSFTAAVDGDAFTPFYYVNANTTYYVRSYVKINGSYYYGNQVSFKTAGYTGGSGGFVFFDKGETTNGWRYLEAAPTSLSTSSFSSFKWTNEVECGYSFISGIGNAIGDGANNTTLIKSNCNYSNIGATMCRATSLNGKTDWFLPSIDEVKELYKLTYPGLINISSGSYLLSSSQSSNTLCFIFKTSNLSAITTDKNYYQTAWQVRRF